MQRVETLGRGSAFAAADFHELGSRAAIDQALSRLTRQGKIRRLGRGVYDYPKHSALLGTDLSPLPEAVAQAVARKSDERLLMSGAQAANRLGLSEQVPARVVYLTTGRSRKVKIGPQTIELRHTAPRYAEPKGEASAMVIQALRHLGRKHVDQQAIERLRRSLSPEDKAALLQDSIHAPEWMRAVIAQVAAE